MHGQALRHGIGAVGFGGSSACWSNRVTAREVLIQVGLVEFLAHGYDGVGMAQILAAAGVSRGGFYHHFSGKLELFEQVIDQHLSSPLTSLDWAAHGKLDAKAQKLVIAELYAGLAGLNAAENGAGSGDLSRYYALFFDALSRLPRFRQNMNKTYHQLLAYLAEALEREGNSSDISEREARTFIATFEGELYLSAVTDSAWPEHQEH